MKVLQWGLSGLVFLGVGFLSPVIFSAEPGVFKCVHSDGRTEFRGVFLQGADCVAYDRWQRSVSPAASIDDDAAQERTPSGTQQTEEDLWARNCEVARDNLELLESDTPVVVTGEGGQAVLLSDSDRVERLRRTERDVAYWCGAPPTGQ